MKTLSALASELGLTRQAVHARVRSLGIKPERVGNRLVLTAREARRIRNPPKRGRPYKSVPNHEVAPE